MFSQGCLTTLKSDLSEHACVREKMNKNYTDSGADKLEMMGEIKQERAERGLQKEKQKRMKRDDAGRERGYD